MDYQAFIEFVKAAFPDLTPDQEERFKAMGPLYEEWNARINVISRKDIGNLYDHHILHSLAVARYLQLRPGLLESFRGASVLDLGTGGGFPGIPLAVLFPSASFVLCDSVGKKTIVASEVAKGLGLGNVRIVNARAESLGETFDFVVSRAVASLTDFYPWVKGRFRRSILYLKGGDLVEEIASMMGRFRLPAGSYRLNGLTVSSPQEAFLVVFEHETTHAVEYALFGSTGHSKRFLSLAGGLFGHTGIHHELPTRAQESAQQGLRPGAAVSFLYQGKTLTGLVQRVGKTATVMVPDPRGPYRDTRGRRYTKFRVSPGYLRIL